MPTNETGYDISLGPDKDGKYITVLAGESYDEPEPVEHPEGAIVTDEPEPQPLAVTTQQTPTPAANTKPAQPETPAPTEAEPEHGTDQKAE